MSLSDPEGSSGKSPSTQGQVYRATLVHKVGLPKNGVTSGDAVNEWHDRGGSAWHHSGNNLTSTA